MDYLVGQSTLFIAVFLLWGLPLKGFALWRAAKLDHKKWFIAILVLNLMGSLELLYLLFYNKQKQEKRTWLVEFVKEKFGRGLSGRV